MIRDIKIHPVLNGFVVTVGCQALVFDNTCKLIEELHAYLNDPDKREDIYREKSINRWLLSDCPPAPPNPCCEREERAVVNSLREAPKPFLNR